MFCTGFGQKALKPLLLDIISDIFVGIMRIRLPSLSVLRSASVVVTRWPEVKPGT